MEMKTITEIVNNMTADEYNHMLDVFFGEVPKEIKKMTDEELLSELYA